MFKLLLRGLFLSLLGAPLLAEGNVVLAECDEGGCSCLLTDLSISDATIVLGQAPPAGATDPVLVESDGEYTWSALPVEDIDLVFGGTGECLLALFPAIVPLDGSWLGTVGERVVGANCPAGVSGMLDPMLAGINERRQVVWDGVFHPVKIGDGHGPSGIVWTMITEDRFSGVQQFPNLGTAGRISANWTSIIKDPEYIRSNVDISILGICDVSAVVDFRRTGP